MLSKLNSIVSALLPKQAREEQSPMQEVTHEELKQLQLDRNVIRCVIRC